MKGDIVENFILKNQNGNDFNLFENLDKKVLIVFYPRDNSPVCSRQLSNYYENKKAFEDYDIKVIGINTESGESHSSFCNSLGIDMPMLCDETKEISRRFNALNLFGVNKRKLILIGIDKKILFEKSSVPVLYFNTDRIITMFNEEKLI
ncbi:MAG: peroxiredoxin family protein [Ignavibacteriaceae bacterium]|jgi:peroxiredoxin